MANIYTLTPVSGPTVQVVADSFMLDPTAEYVIFQNVATAIPGQDVTYTGNAFFKLSNYSSGILTSPAPPDFSNVAFTNEANVFIDPQTMPHIEGLGTSGWVPSISVDSSAGVGATAIISGTDMRGEITLTTGTGTFPGTLVTITFGTPYTADTTPIVLTNPANTAAVAVLSPAMPASFILSGTPADTHTYQWFYHVLG